MEEDIRYKIQHMGDIFIETLCDVINAAKGSAKGIVLTYDINELKKKKRRIIRKIGERLVQIRKDDPESHMPDDDMLKNLFSELEKIQNNIDAYVKERGV